MQCWDVQDCSLVAYEFTCCSLTAYELTWLTGGAICHAQVTELPNVHFANGYQHHGNLRLIISSPPRDPCFPPGLICCGELC